MYGIEYLILPEAPTDFINRFWGEAALYIPGHPQKFASLFGAKEVHWFLKRGALDYPNIRLVLDGEVATTSTPLMDDIDCWRRRGATLILTGIHRWHPKISKYVSVLHKEINAYLQVMNIHVNCYTSMPSKQGFDCHYDLHHVFILQVQGKKSWRVFPPTMKWIMSRDTTLKPPNAPPDLECVLSEGDVLYIPQGHWHAAVAIEESIHLTVGVHVRTGIDFMRWMVDELTNDPTRGKFFRKHLPAATPDDANRALKSHICELEERAIAYIQNLELAEKFITDCNANIDAEMNHLHRMIFERGAAAATDPLIEQGRRAEKEAIARSLLEKGLELSFIADVTGLQHREIQALRKPARTDE
jgi:ribosomal protein L16 Arg81 hydroxylase